MPGFTNHTYGWITRGGGGGPHSAWVSDGSATKALWHFAEASGNVIDAVNSISSTVNGTPTYSVSATGLWVNLSPGITTGAGNFFANTTPSALLDITTAFVFEFAALTTASGSTNRPFSFWQAANHGYEITYQGASTTINLYLEASDGTTVNSNFSGITEFADSGYHKTRIAGTFGGNAECFIDGQSKGTIGLSTLSGKTVPCGGLFVLCANAAGGNPWTGTALELKITIGNATANSGGPGGG